MKVVHRTLFRWFARWTRPVARRVAAWSRHRAVVDRALARGVAHGVAGYRIFLSPLKGYRCAHAALTGGPSCSDVALDAFRTLSFSEGLQATEAQLARCRGTYFGDLPDAVDQALRHLPNLDSSQLPAVMDIDCCHDEHDKKWP